MHAKIRLSFLLPVVNGLLWPSWIKAQQLVEYDELGILFEVPAGWSSQGSDAGCLLISERREIDLCQDGSFSLAGSSSISVGVSGTFGVGRGRSSGTDQWGVIRSDSDARLRLRFDDGSEWVPSIRDRDGQTFRDNTRHFRTYVHARCF